MGQAGGPDAWSGYYEPLPDRTWEAGTTASPEREPEPHGWVPIDPDATPTTPTATAPPAAAGQAPGEAPEAAAPEAIEEVDKPVAEPAPAAGSGRGRWWRHVNERWVIDDAGSLPMVKAKASKMFRWSPPDTVVDGAHVGDLIYRAASVRGLSHQESGQLRQDAYQVRFTRDQTWLVGCIADGVSAGRRSHEAAQIVCNEISDAVVDAMNEVPLDRATTDHWPEVIDRVPWSEAVKAANDEIVERTRELLQTAYERQGETDKREAVAELLPHSHVRTVMSATAMAFVVSTRLSPYGELLVAVANIAGDSAGFVLKDGNWTAITAIKNEGKDVFGSSVRALPTEAAPHTDCRLLPPGAALVLMTDGLGDPLGSARGVVSEFLTEKWSRPPDILAFAEHLSFYRKSFTDDRTAVVVWARARTE